MINSITEFVAFCNSASNDEIYEMFEFDISEELREEVYSYADPDAAEPFRSAMNNLGFVAF